MTTVGSASRVDLKNKLRELSNQVDTVKEMDNEHNESFMTIKIKSPGHATKKVKTNSLKNSLRRAQSAVRNQTVTLTKVSLKPNSKPMSKQVSRIAIEKANTIDENLKSTTITLKNSYQDLNLLRLNHQRTVATKSKPAIDGGNFLQALQRRLLQQQNSKQTLNLEKLKQIKKPFSFDQQKQGIAQMKQIVNQNKDLV